MRASSRGSGIGACLFEQEFEGNDAVQLRFFGSIKHAIPAAPQRVENTIMRHHGIQQDAPPGEIVGTGRKLLRSGRATEIAG